ncbi:MAG TPA: ABC transporter permease [Gammaproteobacteria bacterium]|jgi:peptide/nickel transport system permease protein|nr:ABC transporter permease [Gammaproteobacteria bacterium]
MRLRVPLLIVLVWAIAALLADSLPLTPDRIALEHILDPPASGAVLGYDDLGRDIASRLLVGARTSFLVAVWVVGLSMLVGTLFGTLTAYRGGWWDRVAVLLVDTFLAFPGILLAIALAGLLGPGIENVIMALTAVGWVGYARLSRAQVLSLMNREHVQAAVALGNRRWRIVRRHLLPLMAAPLIVEATFGVAAVVIAEAGLSFLGLGVQPPAASWGAMIRDGTRYMLVAPHMVLAPGVAIMLIVLAVNLLGDALRDRMDTRLVVNTGGGE